MPPYLHTYNIVDAHNEQHGEVYSIQHYDYVTKFVSDLQPRYNRNIVESDVKHK